MINKSLRLTAGFLAAVVLFSSTPAEWLAVEDQNEKEIENVLKKAQERSDEHEAQKKAREMRRRLPPNERDW